MRGALSVMGADHPHRVMRRLPGDVVFPGDAVFPGDGNVTTKRPRGASETVSPSHHQDEDEDKDEGATAIDVDAKESDPAVRSERMRHWSRMVSLAAAASVLAVRRGRRRSGWGDLMPTVVRRVTSARVTSVTMGVDSESSSVDF